MINKIVLIILLTFTSLSAYASVPFFIKIHNNSATDAIITPVGVSEHWECGDLCKTQLIKAGQTVKFTTKTTAHDFFKLTTGLQTFNIAYGNRNVKVQVWIEHKHDVDENVSTAVVYVHAYNDLKYVTSVTSYLAGIGTDSEHASTNLYVDKLSYGFGEAHASLTLTD